LINSEKASIASVFEENVERFLCSRFSITQTHDRIFTEEAIGSKGKKYSEEITGSKRDPRSNCKKQKASQKIQNQQ
jgi:hypothetical protein